MEHLMTTEELAGYLNCSVQSIRLKVNDNTIPFIRLGENGAYRFNPEEVMKALQQYK